MQLLSDDQLQMCPEWMRFVYHRITDTLAQFSHIRFSETGGFILVEDDEIDCKTYMIRADLIPHNRAYPSIAVGFGDPPVGLSIGIREPVGRRLVYVQFRRWTEFDPSQINVLGEEVSRLLRTWLEGRLAVVIESVAGHTSRIRVLVDEDEVAVHSVTSIGLVLRKLIDKRAKRESQTKRVGP